MAGISEEGSTINPMKLRNAVSLPHHLSLPPQLPSSCTVCLYPMVVYTSHVKKGHNSRIKCRVHEVWVTLHTNEFINKCIIIDVPWLIHHALANSTKVNKFGKVYELPWQMPAHVKAWTSLQKWKNTENATCSHRNWITSLQASVLVTYFWLTK